MKKIFGIIVLIIIIFILAVKYIPFGYTTFESRKIQARKLTIPKMSYFEEECCMFSANFKSFRSKFILEKELNNIMKKYEKIRCGKNVYYYNRESDITITYYGVERDGLLNRIYIVYDKGDIYSECRKEK